jgi:hypothetical protein
MTTTSLINNNFQSFIIDTINCISFPATVTFDFAGFVLSGEDPVFQFPSASTCLKLINDMDTFTLTDLNSKVTLIEFWNSLTMDQVKERWYNAHDAVTFLSVSGLRCGRLITSTIYVCKIRSF